MIFLSYADVAGAKMHCHVVVYVPCAMPRGARRCVYVRLCVCVHVCEHVCAHVCAHVISEIKHPFS